MRRFARILAAGLIGLLLGPARGLAEEQKTEPVFHVDFSRYEPEKGTVRQWLSDEGFAFERDAADEDGIVLRFEDDLLHVRTEAPAFGLIHHEEDVKNVSRIRLRWGVADFPEGASYERQVDNEALMVYVFFGHEELPSGSLFIPDSPYFIGLFLCDRDRVERPYKGHYYHDGGRFVCLGHPEPGQVLTSEFDLAEAFTSYFGKERVPAISGMSLEVDTSRSADHGHAAAFIQRIEFLE